MLDKLGFLLEEYLKSHETWQHVHSESIGDVEKTTPWREDVWRHASGWAVVHWQNLKHHPYMSGPTPRHSWKLSFSQSKEPWVLTLEYGVAPHE